MSSWTKSLALERAFDYCYARITKQLFHSYMCVNQLSYHCFPKEEGEWINRGWKLFKNLHYSQSSAHLRLTSTIMTDLPGKYVLYISSVDKTNHFIQFCYLCIVILVLFWSCFLFVFQNFGTVQHFNNNLHVYSNLGTIHYLASALPRPCLCLEPFAKLLFPETHGTVQFGAWLIDCVYGAPSLFNNRQEIITGITCILWK